MRRTTAVAVLVLVAACAPRPDPGVQAARDFQKTAYDLIQRDEQRMARLNSLQIGMTDREVLEAAGPPSRRHALGGGGETAAEIWTYSGELKQLGTLTFEGRKLVQIQIN